MKLRQSSQDITSWHKWSHQNYKAAKLYRWLHGEHVSHRDAVNDTTVRFKEKTCNHYKYSWHVDRSQLRLLKRKYSKRYAYFKPDILTFKYK